MAETKTSFFLKIKNIDRDISEELSKVSIASSDQSASQFPIEIRNVDPEDHQHLLHVFQGFQNEFLRVGPKRYIVPKEYEKHGADIYNMPLRPTDIFVAAYQRSGTTWTQELVWMVANDMDYKTAKMIPLTQRYPFLEMIMLFNTNFRNVILQNDDGTERAQKAIKVLLEPATKWLAVFPDPRFIKTHLPMSLLPPSLLDTAKMVYVARDPRDVAVSSYYHTARYVQGEYKVEFKKFWNSFLKNLFMLTPYFEHVKEAWAMKDHRNMLFMFYEDLLQDMPASIRRVADFLGKEVTEDDVTGLCDHLHVENFKLNHSVTYDELKDVGIVSPDETFIITGKAGGWRDYFDEEMTLQAERWIADNLRDTDLRFPSMK